MARADGAEPDGPLPDGGDAAEVLRGRVPQELRDRERRDARGGLRGAAVDHAGRAGRAGGAPLQAAVDRDEEPHAAGAERRRLGLLRVKVVVLI